MASVSTSSAMRFIVVTASTGYCPAADSAESMTASAPSKIAVATSETSARVGTGLVIIDSSIWVATTTGLPARRGRGGIFFLAPGRPPPRLAGAAGRSRHLFPDARLLAERPLDAEIPARHQPGVGDVEGLVEP